MKEVPSAFFPVPRVLAKTISGNGVHEYLEGLKAANGEREAEMPTKAFRPKQSKAQQKREKKGGRKQKKRERRQILNGN